MLKPRFNDLRFILFFVPVFFGLTGCDQIKAIAEYFHKPEQKASSQPAQPAPAEPVSFPQENNPPASMPSDALARVGNWSITVDEFNARLKALKEAVPNFDITNMDSKKLVLEELIRQQLLVADAEQSGIAKQKDIQDAVEEFRRTIIVREVAKKITEGVNVTSDEAKAFYEQNKDKITEPAEFHVREIVVDSQEKANNLLIELLKGTDFAQVAKANSISKSAANNGDLGFIKDEEISFPQMYNALASLEAGNISSVFKGPEGFYIVKLEEKKGGKLLSFDEVKDQIILNQKVMKQQKVILDYLETLKSKFKVETNESLLK